MLVAADTADDAGVVQLTDDLAIVQTVDFFTPIVDDPYAFGRIAATNALSDIYAMGGRPVSALNLVAYPLETLGPDVLREILRGGADAAAAAGAAIVGGHSIDDPEPKYGMAVTGVVAPGRGAHQRRRPGRRRARPHQAARRGRGGDRDQARPGRRRAGRARVAVMTTLNDRAAEQARAAGAHALTDVTGFGLLGHVHELAAASGLAAEIDAGAVPAIDGVLELLETDAAVAGGSRRNRADAETFTRFADGVPEPRRRLVLRRDDLRRPARRRAARPRRRDRRRGRRPPGRRRARDDQGRVDGS